MRNTALLILAAVTLSGCAALDPQSGQVVMRIESLSRELTELRSDVRATKEQLESMDEQDNVARIAMADRVETLERSVARLPARVGSQCRAQTATDSECTAQTRAIEMQGEKAVLGELERVWLAPPDVAMVARIDTGATSSSLHATDLVEFERDGEDWVRFELHSEEATAEFEAPIVRKVRVVQQADPDGTRRPVVAIRVRVGEIDETVEFTLADRSHLENPLILGRNFLQDLAVVDVGRQFVQPAFAPE